MNFENRWQPVDIENLEAQIVNEEEIINTF